MANHLPITSSCPLRHARVYHDFRERQRPRAEKSIGSLHAPSLFAWLEHTPDCCASAGPVLVLDMGKHMDAKTTALCYFYRHPPRQSGVKPVPYRKIPKLLPVGPLPTLNQVWRAVKTFHVYFIGLVRCLYITCTLLDHFA